MASSIIVNESVIFSDSTEKGKKILCEAVQEREPICVKEKLKISHKAHLGNHPWNVHNTHFEKP